MTIKEFTYEPYKNVKVESSTSSYGRWMVKTSEVTFNWFWRKAQAVEFANRINNDALNGILHCTECDVMLNYEYTTTKYACPACHTVYEQPHVKQTKEGKWFSTLDY